MGSRIVATVRAGTAALLLLAAPSGHASEGSGTAMGSGVEASAAASPEEAAAALVTAAEDALARGDRLTAATRYEEIVSRFPSLRVARIARLKARQLRTLQADPEPDLRAAFDDAKLHFARNGAEASTAAILALEPRAQSPALQQDISLWLADRAARNGNTEEARLRYDGLLLRETLTPAQATAAVAGLLRNSDSFRERASARSRIHHALAIRPDQVPPEVALRMVDEANDHLFSLVALYASCITLLLAALHIANGLLRRTASLPAGFWRPTLLFPLYAFAGAGLFAESWEHGRLLPFAGAGVAVTLLLLLLRTADALRPPAGAWRFVTASLHVATLLAALYLVLYAANLQHLMGL